MFECLSILVICRSQQDGELKVMVKKILEGANLEEVTMKSVCRQVYDSYPDFDLTHKKLFIKETVKSVSV